MIIFFILSCIIILLISLIISLIANKYYKLYDTCEIKNYLFGYNTIVKSTFSNIGSILSLTTFIGVTIGSIITCGFEALFFLPLAIFLGYFSFALIIKNIFNDKIIQNTYEIKYNEKNCNNDINSTKVTIISLVDNNSKKFFGNMQVLLYIIFIIVELVLAKIFMNTLFPNFESINQLTIFILIFMCALYVSTGGYVGVLITDMFQVVSVLICLIILGYIFRNNIDFYVIEIYNKINITFDEILLYITYFIFILLYCFSLPDVWVRNVGTLKYKNSFIIPSLIFGLLGVLVVISLSMLYGIYLESTIKDSSDVFLLPQIIKLMAKSLYSSKIIMENPIYIFILIIAIFCMFITTIDTWLIGISQHVYYNFSSQSHSFFRFIPFIVAGGTWCISSFIEYSSLLYLSGLILSLILYGNFLVLVRSINLDFKFEYFYKESRIDYNHLLTLYYLIAFLSNGIMLIVLSPIKIYVGLMIGAQIVIGFIIFFIFPLFFEKRKLHD